MLPAALRLIHNGEMDFKTLIRAMSTRPAELLGLPGGTLRAGSPADVVVIDPDTPWVLDPADLKSQCKNTPFDEARFSGRVVRTIVGGRTVFEHGGRTGPRGPCRAGLAPRPTRRRHQ